eukprot:TRINITY_DN14099_c0_g1_i1.p1 TRINITY_DN14099_c0_g1~~TRINITY_DN14099_c0_g1_i1.p1  ORF type:complete len:1642 (-),score=267.49 TRINITY_DN14099_c0_g1_i1:43-4968(-)
MPTVAAAGAQRRTGSASSADARNSWRKPSGPRKLHFEAVSGSGGGTGAKGGSANAGAGSVHFSRRPGDSRPTPRTPSPGQRSGSRDRTRPGIQGHTALRRPGSALGSSASGASGDARQAKPKHRTSSPSGGRSARSAGLALEAGRRRVLVLPPSDLELPADSAEAPEEELVLERAHGCSSGPGDHIMPVRSSGEALYVAGGVVVVHDPKADHQRFFVGHTRRVTCLAVRSSEDLVASGQEGLRHEGSWCFVWRLSTCEIEARLSIEDRRFDAIEWSQDGSVLFACASACPAQQQQDHRRGEAASPPRSIYIWSYDSPGHPLAWVVPYPDPVMGIRAHYSDPGCCVAYGAAHLSFLAANPEELDSVQRWCPRWDASGPPRSILCAVYLPETSSPDDGGGQYLERLLALGTSDGEVFLLRNDQVVSVARRSLGAIRMLEPAPRGGLFCGTSDGKLEVLDLSSLEPLYTADIGEACACRDPTQTRFEARSMALLELMPPAGGADIGGRIALSTDQHGVWFCSFSGLGSQAPKLDVFCGAQGAAGDALGLDVSPALSGEVALAGSRGVVRFLGGGSAARNSFRCGNACGSASCLGFSPSGNLLAVGTGTGRLLLLATPPPPSTQQSAPFAHERGRRRRAGEPPASATADAALGALGAAPPDARELCGAQVSRERLTVLQWTARGDRLAVGAADHRVYLINVAMDCGESPEANVAEHEHWQASLLRPVVLTGSSAAVLSLQFSLCTRYLMANTADHRISFWEVETGRREVSMAETRDVRWYRMTQGGSSSASVHASPPGGAALVRPPLPWRSTLGWPVVGIWSRPSAGDTQGDPCAVESAPSRPLCAFGDKLGRVSLSRFPAPQQETRTKAYQAHASQITGVRWLAGGAALLTAGGADGTLLQWRLRFRRTTSEVSSGRDVAATKDNEYCSSPSRALESPQKLYESDLLQKTFGKISATVATQTDVPENGKSGRGEDAFESRTADSGTPVLLSQAARGEDELPEARGTLIWLPSAGSMFPSESGDGYGSATRLAPASSDGVDAAVGVDALAHGAQEAQDGFGYSAAAEVPSPPAGRAAAVAAAAAAEAAAAVATVSARIPLRATEARPQQSGPWPLAPAALNSAVAGTVPTVGDAQPAVAAVVRGRSLSGEPRYVAQSKSRSPEPRVVSQASAAVPSVVQNGSGSFLVRPSRRVGPGATNGVASGGSGATTRTVGSLLPVGVRSASAERAAGPQARGRPATARPGKHVCGKARYKRRVESPPVPGDAPQLALQSPRSLSSGRSTSPHRVNWADINIEEVAGAGELSEIGADEVSGREGKAPNGGASRVDASDSSQVAAAGAWPSGFGHAAAPGAAHAAAPTYFGVALTAYQAASVDSASPRGRPLVVAGAAPRASSTATPSPCQSPSAPCYTPRLPAPAVLHGSPASHLSPPMSCAGFSGPGPCSAFAPSSTVSPATSAAFATAGLMRSQPGATALPNRGRALPTASAGFCNVTSATPRANSASASPRPSPGRSRASVFCSRLPTQQSLMANAVQQPTLAPLSASLGLPAASATTVAGRASLPASASQSWTASLPVRREVERQQQQQSRGRRGEDLRSQAWMHQPPRVASASPSRRPLAGPQVMTPPSARRGAAALVLQSSMRMSL